MGGLTLLANAESLLVPLLTLILQVKVLRDPTKKDSKGNPQGKGIAFAEFSDPEHALCALRQLNNNPAPFGEIPILKTSEIENVVLPSGALHKFLIGGSTSLSGWWILCSLSE